MSFLGNLTKLSIAVNKVTKTANDIDSIQKATKGDTGKIKKRVRNKVKAKALKKAGFWK